MVLGEGYRELQPPIGRIWPPVRGNFGLSSEEILQNGVQNLHCLAIFSPLMKILTPLVEDKGVTEGHFTHGKKGTRFFQNKRI